MAKKPSVLIDHLPALLSVLENEERTKFKKNLNLQNDESFLFSILCFAIDCRGCGSNSTSLLLLNWLIDRGVEHPLVLDNKIRALVDGSRFVEALALLPMLSTFNEPKIYSGSVQCLLPHQQSLLKALRHHCSTPLGDLLDSTPFPSPYSENFLLEILRLAISLNELGDSSRALALLQELMQWGKWCLDALTEEAQILWSILVIRLGSDVLSDLSLYQVALARLGSIPDAEAAWELVKVNFDIQIDSGQSERALLSVVGFVVENPAHRASRIWLTERQNIPLRTNLRGCDGARVRIVDQSIAVDSLLLDCFLKRRLG